MLTLAVRGGRAGLTDPPANEDEVHERASAAYGRARADAEKELVILLGLLFTRASSREVEPRARSALDAVGMLWETSARLNEK